MAQGIGRVRRSTGVYYGSDTNTSVASLDDTSNDSAISMHSHHHVQSDVTYLSPENKDANTSDDSSGDISDSSCSPGGLQTTGLTPSMDDLSLCIDDNLSPLNATEKPLTKFEDFISNEWPEGWEGELQVLHLQLMHGGEFCENMKVIDLSTPAHVRPDVTEVLSLLEVKISTNKYAMKHVHKLVLPDVRELASGDMVKEVIENYCRVLRSERTAMVKIAEVVIRCDKVSNNFTAGNLRWIEGFHTCNKLGAITVSSYIITCYSVFYIFNYRYFVLRKVKTKSLKSFVCNFVASRKRLIIILRNHPFNVKNGSH